MKSLLLSILALFLAEWYIRQDSGEAPPADGEPGYWRFSVSAVT